MTNREISEMIFNSMKKFGFKPYNIEYGNCYFIFEGPEDSIVHFRVKGVWRSWKFGMWIHSEYMDNPEAERDDEYKVVSFFAQHDHCIDKFKPTRSSLLVEYSVSEWHEIMEEYENGKNLCLIFYRIEDMLKFMKWHPVLAYDGFCGQYAGYETGFLRRFLSHEFYLLKKNIQYCFKWLVFVPYTKFKCRLAKKDKCIHELIMSNFEKDNPGWCTDHKYEIIIKFAAESTDEEMYNWMTRWFKRDDYGRFGAWDSIVHVEPLSKEGEEGWFSFD